ncbi:MAG: BON domain-containing protein [Symbiobacteriia bacterium]
MNRRAGIDVKVDVKQGVVQLVGIVDVLSHRQQAEEIARSMTGVHGVENGITVAMDGDVADEAIEAADDATVVNRVEQALKDAGLNGRHIDTAAEGGRLRLSGSVDTSSQREQAEHPAAEANGVRAVANELDLRSGDGEV